MSDIHSITLAGPILISPRNDDIRENTDDFRSLIIDGAEYKNAVHDSTVNQGCAEEDARTHGDETMGDDNVPNTVGFIAITSDSLKDAVSDVRDVKEVNRDFEREDGQLSASIDEDIVAIATTSSYIFPVNEVPNRLSTDSIVDSNSSKHLDVVVTTYHSANIDDSLIDKNKQRFFALQDIPQATSAQSAQTGAQESPIEGRAEKDVLHYVEQHKSNKPSDSAFDSALEIDLADTRYKITTPYNSLRQQAPEQKAPEQTELIVRSKAISASRIPDTFNSDSDSNMGDLSDRDGLNNHVVYKNTTGTEERIIDNRSDHSPIAEQDYAPVVTEENVTINSASDSGATNIGATQIRDFSSHHQIDIPYNATGEIIEHHDRTKQVIEAIRSYVTQNGEHYLELVLHPKELGIVNISIKVTDGSIRDVTIFAKDEALGILRQDSAQLQEALHAMTGGDNGASLSFTSHDGDNKHPFYHRHTNEKYSISSYDSCEKLVTMTSNVASGNGLDTIIDIMV